MLDDDPRIGSRIQRLRRQKGVSQAQCAQVLDISPSYLNLIEHNRRRITVPLLMKISAYFGVGAGELVESDESRLTGDLMEMFGDEVFADSEVTRHDIRDLASSNPKLGQAVVRLFDRFRAFRAAGGGEGGYDPATDAVSDFLQENANYFPALETAAERVRHDMDLASESLDQGLKAYLLNVFGLRWQSASLPDDEALHVNQDRHEIHISDTVPAETATFEVARQLGLLAAAADIERLLEDSTLLTEAWPIARRALAAYFAAAVIMPYESFHRACRDTRYDIERLARRFGASFEQICHRMTTLQRPGLSGIPLHLVRTDIAGNISKRFSLSGIHIPRHAGACPRWNVYSAFLHPEQINIQISQMPEGQRYFCIARAFTKGGYRHNAPRRHFSIGLGCHISHAGGMVYSDGIDMSNTRQVVPIGVGCRLCPRDDCGQRAHPYVRPVAAGPV